MTADTQTDKLIRMANQIATFFEVQPGDRAEAVAAHINDNWSAPMRAELLGALAAPELKALVREAAPLILRARR